MNRDIIGIIDGKFEELKKRKENDEKLYKKRKEENKKHNDLMKVESLSL